MKMKCLAQGDLSLRPCNQESDSLSTELLVLLLVKEWAHYTGMLPLGGLARNSMAKYITETSPYKSDPRFPPNIIFTYSKNGGNLGSESK